MAAGRWRRLLAGALGMALSGGCIGDPVDPHLSDEERQALEALAVDTPPAGLIQTEAAFEGVHLAGYLLEPRTLTLRAGSEVTLTLVWRVEAPLPSGYRPFTHLLGPDGRLLANLDDAGPLRAKNGLGGVPWPPSRWKPGSYQLDRLRFTVPADAPDKVRIAVGFYRGRARLTPRGGATDARGGFATIALAVEGARPVSSVPELTAPKLPSGTTLTVDGLLDEPSWNRAARTGAFVDPRSGRAEPRLPVQGSARLLYDDQHLYLGFEVSDRELRGGFPTGAVDPHLWTRDTVEVMIDPDGDGDGRDYYEIQISPQNLVFDSRFDSYNQPRGGPDGPFGHQDWSARLTSAVSLRGSLDDDGDVDEGYTVEAAIPWASFTAAARTPPQVGDAWRLNFYAMQNNGGAAWSPLLGQGNFHRASRFGRVRWGEPLAETSSP
jgi:hypothetical protein